MKVLQADDAHSLKLTCFLLLTFAATSTLSQNIKCPFRYLFFFGDGYSDIGNSIRTFPFGPFLPAARLPYGKTFPGVPTGRWSDGLADADYVAMSLGISNIVPYLSRSYKFRSNNGVVFSTAGSPVLEREFFTSRGISIPSYGVPLRDQLKWFNSYLKSICSTTTTTECAGILPNSIVVLGDVEGNDIGYPLSQGRSIQEVKGYIPIVTNRIIQVATEFISMGATRVAITGNIPLGCIPYMLTKMRSANPADYDDLGCLKNLNNLTQYKNSVLQQAVTDLSMRYPSVGVYFAELYEPVRTMINQTNVVSGGNALKACCGIGGKYNFNEKRFCGSLGVPVCSNPNQYIYWDGVHFTQEAYSRLVNIVDPPFLPVLNCTTT